MATHLPSRYISVLLLRLLHKMHENSESDIFDPRGPDEVGLRLKVVVHRYLHEIPGQMRSTR